jgi:beta-glucosidase
MSVAQFPPGFLWGAATSAHQVEGNNVHSDWWAWEQAGRVREASGQACDHYRRFAEDFDAAVSLGHNAHRFSVEWARLEPEPGAWDEAALGHYVDVVRALRQRGIEPIVTLHHFTNPQWLLARGGWTVPETVERFAGYVRRVSDALGGTVRYWITVNEPMVYVRMHYLEGLGPPGHRSLPEALRVIRHLVEGHAAAYRILHERQADARVSIAQYAPAFRPCRAWCPPDRLVAGVAERLFHGALLEALMTGSWRVPGIGAWRLPDRTATLDYLGVNFYGRKFIRWVPTLRGLPGEPCDLRRHRGHTSEITSFGWDIDPASFAETLRELHRSLQLPLLVTENGAWIDDDSRRQAFIEGHVGAVAAALQDGAEVLGYCYWSLMDNFEWAEGFTPRFGLIEIDYPTQRRTIRGSAQRYAEICRANRLERA